MPESHVASLYQESVEIEREASQLQADQGGPADDGRIAALVSAYHDWYGRALDALPQDFEELFRSEYEGSLSVPRLRRSWRRRFR